MGYEEKTFPLINTSLCTNVCSYINVSKYLFKTEVKVAFLLNEENNDQSQWQNIIIKRK